MIDNQPTNAQFLLFVSENAEVLQQIAAWLSDDAGELHPTKVAQLAQLMHPTDAEAAQAFEISKLGADSPNGNSVSIEDQMARGARAVADHELALGVLRKSMDLIRMSIGRR